MPSAPGDLIATEARELQRTTERLMAQLAVRLEVELGDADALAVLTAVMAAAQEGARRGAKATIYAAEVQARRRGLRLHLDMPLPPALDLWAERYGGEGE